MHELITHVLQGIAMLALPFLIVGMVRECQD